MTMYKYNLFIHNNLVVFQLFNECVLKFRDSFKK